MGRRVDRTFDAPLVVASNRGPVTFERGETGEPIPRRGAGGLVTALTGALQQVAGIWVATAMTDADREAAARAEDGQIRAMAEGAAYRLRYLDIPRRLYDGYYDGIANGVLWFVHHYLWDTPRTPVFGEATRAAWEDYVEVNRRFATALAEEGDRQPGAPAYLVQDYHLSLVPRMLRELRPDALIAHFSHTPFAGATYLRVLPKAIREGVLRGLLGADVLGFHSQQWAENFLMSARSLPGARADLARSRVTVEGREVLIRVHPISVDAGNLRTLAESSNVRAIRADLERWRGDRRLLVRVDRLELTKNVVRGFQAYELLLRRDPTLRGRIVFLALLSPSRMAVPEYRTYMEECRSQAERVNREFGDSDWRPIELRVEDDYFEVVAALGIYDVLLVNPVFDGMNLVAMEGPLVNRTHGVLVLSRNAGAYWRLGRHAVAVNPFDVAETADALATALAMSGADRTRRARGLARLVLANPPERWVNDQLEDLERSRRRRRPSASSG